MVSYDSFHINRLSVVKTLFKSEEDYFNACSQKINSYEEYAQLENYFLQ
jgi:hypothetical protein